MKTITLMCKNCNKNFERELKIYTYRQLKMKLPPFCGQPCSAAFHNKMRSKSSWKGNGDRIKFYADNKRDEFSPFRYFIAKCKWRSKEYDLDLEYLKELWESQKGICPYTGFAMDLHETMCPKKSSLKRASLDRIDSSKGYVKGNVEFVCLLINYAKNKYSKEDVKQFVDELKSNSICA